MNPIAAVLVGHLIGDWIIQTDWQAANKMRSWKANQEHILGYHLCLLFFCWFTPMSTSSLVFLYSVSWITHSFIDRRWPVKKLMKLTKSYPFSQTTFGVIVVDQALHLSILLTIAGVV